MQCYYHGVSFPAQHLSAYASGEPEETQLLLRVLRPADRVLIAGGGLGWLALVAAAVVTPARVVVYEPNAERCRIIWGGLRIDDQWVCAVHQGAVAATDGTVALARSPEHWSMDTLANDGERVPGYALDTLIVRHQSTVLALDIEGGEHAVLPVSTLAGLRAAVIEVHRGDLAPILLHLAGVGLRVTATRRRDDGRVFLLAERSDR